MTPLKAIRAKCLDCCRSQAAEVRQCPVTDCSLWPFRFGKNPNLKGVVRGASARAAKVKQANRPSFAKNPRPARDSGTLTQKTTIEPRGKDRAKKTLAQEAAK